MIKEFPPTSHYPYGGLRIVVTCYRAKPLYARIDYLEHRDSDTGKIDKRMARMVAEAKEKEFRLLGKQQQIERKHGRGGVYMQFAEAVKTYRKAQGHHADISLITDMMNSFGDADHTEWRERFERFMLEQEKRKSYKKIPLSPATLKAYRRYFKAICGYVASDKVVAHARVPTHYGIGVTVGKTERRTGTCSPVQTKKILEFIGNEYEWFLPVIEFARIMPIRVEDLICSMLPAGESREYFWKVLPKDLWHKIGLTWDKVSEAHNMIPYLPKKTWKTGKLATPVIPEKVKAYVMARSGDSECPAVFCRPVGDHRELIPQTLVRSIWERACGASETKGVTFYEFTRHDSVNLLLNMNVPEHLIMAYAGWSTPDMIRIYDNADINRNARASREIFANAPEAIARELRRVV